MCFSGFAVQFCFSKASSSLISIENFRNGLVDNVAFFFSSVEESATDLCCVISSLVQVMMDSYSRTKLGFQSLIQKEWVIGGHGFLDRCNHLHQSDKEEV